MLEVTGGPDLGEVEGDVLVVPAFAERVWGPGADRVVEALGEWIDDYLAGRGFTGKAGETASVPGAGALPFEEILFVGLGDEVDAEALRRAAGTAGKAAKKRRRVVTTLHQIDVDGAEDLVTLGFRLGQYRFGDFQTAEPPAATETLVLAGSDADTTRGTVIAEAVAFARDLVNTPSRDKAPSVLAGIAAERLSAAGVEVEVWDADRIAAERLGGLEAVALGSDEPARLVLARYTPEGATKTVAFVGKGIVFDSGGLSIKTASGMETMKTDMSGAAAVFGAVWAVARLGLPVSVVGITPLTENMSGGSALRPGDVYTARNGKTVEVLNTDAEGRIVLSDGLSLASELSPDLIVDIATLTGACMVALGGKIAGAFARHDDAAALVEAAAAAAGEAVWRLPLEKEYRSKLDSTIADMKNIGDRNGGAITASLFLEEFVADLPWVHLDIAGPARADSDEHYVSKGGTGYGVRTLVAVAEALT